MMDPGLLTDVIGIALVAALTVVQWLLGRKHKKDHSEPDEPKLEAAAA